MIANAIFLPSFCREGEPPKAVEEYSFLRGEDPSTMLRRVPILAKSRGGRK